jgi:hypothetical protein
MLHPPISGPGPAPTDRRATDHNDRAMDVLQYGAALLAIVVAVLLASVR